MRPAPPAMVGHGLRGPTWESAEHCRNLRAWPHARGCCLRWRASSPGAVVCETASAFVFPSLAADMRAPRSPAAGAGGGLWCGCLRAPLGPQTACEPRRPARSPLRPSASPSSFRSPDRKRRPVKPPNGSGPKWFRDREADKWPAQRQRAAMFCHATRLAGHPRAGSTPGSPADIANIKSAATRDAPERQRAIGAAESDWHQQRRHLAHARGSVESQDGGRQDIIGEQRGMNSHAEGFIAAHASGELDAVIGE